MNDSKATKGTFWLVLGALLILVIDNLLTILEVP